MTQTIITSDLIKRSMYLISAVASGETPDDADLNDALITFNEMIDSLNLQPLACYAKVNEDLTLIPAQASYDWGTTAGVTGFTSERPIYLEDVTCVRNGITTPVEVITQQQYDLISLKSTSQPLVERVLYVNSFPLGKLICYPIPSEAVILNVMVNRQISGPATLQTLLAYPPGYQRMLRYNLAVELWPEYPNATTDIASIKRIAKEALGVVKLANQDLTPSRFDNVPGVDMGRSWDWRAG